MIINPQVESESKKVEFQSDESYSVNSPAESKEDESAEAAVKAPKKKWVLHRKSENFQKIFSNGNTLSNLFEVFVIYGFLHVFL